MNKMVFGGISVFMIFATVISATAFNVTIPGGDVGASPPLVGLSLSDFTTIYHMNGAAGGRNSVYPTYEYQFDGETVHFNAFISSNSITASENSNVSVILVCPSGNLSTHLVLTGPSTGSGGVYTAPYQGDFVVPPAMTVSGNCPLVLKFSYLANTYTDSLSLLKYLEVNDLLLNPSLTVSQANRNYPNNVINAYNNANPYPVPLTFSLGATDREGQGVLGNLSQKVSRLCGTTPVFCIDPSYQRMSLTGAPSDWRTPDATTGWVYLKELILGGTPSTILQYWQLFYSGSFPLQAYTSQTPESYLYSIY